MFFTKSWKVEIYRTSDGREPFSEWKDRLDLMLKMKVLAKLNGVQHGNFGDRRFVGDGVSELKFKDGLRIYYAEIKQTIILLLCGDIKKAKEYLLDHKRRQK
jgi:putative addiction module killer protein